MSARFGGEPGELVAFAGEILDALCVRSFAPGQPIPIELPDAAGTLSLRGKAVGSRRREDGRFAVRIRMINLRRVERARLSELASPLE